MRGCLLFFAESGEGGQARFHGRPIPPVGKGESRAPAGLPGWGLDRPTALDEVGDDERDEENDRECQNPGPPAVSCDEHIDLRCWG
jgi:hypothetical protein